MGYLDKTFSVADGQPISLYQFTRGDNEQIYRYCDADQDLHINGQIWTATAISDGGRRDGENMTLTLPSDTAVARLYRGRPPSQTVTLTVMRLHWQDNEIRVVFIGNIVEAKRPEIHQTQLISAALSATMDATGLRLTWGRNCPYALYDEDCKVNARQFAVGGLQIEAMTGTTVTVNMPSTLAQGWFTAGYIEWTDDEGVREVRAVTLHQNNQLTLMGGTQKLTVGRRITVYPGCDGRVTTCRDKFRNILNYGGCPHMPDKSPYDGTRIF